MKKIEACMYVQAIHFFRSIRNYNCLNFKRHVFTKLSKCIQLVLLHVHSLAGNFNFAKIEETDGTDDLKTVFYRFEISCIVIMLQSWCEFESTSTQSFSVVCVET